MVEAVVLLWRYTGCGDSLRDSPSICGMSGMISGSRDCGIRFSPAKPEAPVAAALLWLRWRSCQPPPPVDEWLDWRDGSGRPW